MSEFQSAVGFPHSHAHRVEQIALVSPPNVLHSDAGAQWYSVLCHKADCFSQADFAAGSVLSCCTDVFFVIICAEFKERNYIKGTFVRLQEKY